MKTALVVIDVQQSLMDEGIWQSEALLGRINKLLGKARLAQAPVVLVADNRIEPDASFHPALERQVGDIEIEKSVCDAFMDTALDAMLQAQDVRKLVICGLQTDYCIDTSCRQAAALGYDVVLVADAHSTLDSGALKAKQIIAHHNHILRHFDSAKGRVRVQPISDIQFA
ncbi:isochorismatase family protein [Gallaecimonas mangrovi]|uniref:isochorismatase family protein n=1 Tax=Gallaecimonas mangrovi TaxID=2291597 RepID=UPI000E1FEA6F|nr:isochorismatase family protein [Gallaecimonas mangrovi]